MAASVYICVDVITHERRPERSEEGSLKTAEPHSAGDVVHGSRWARCLMWEESWEQAEKHVLAWLEGKQQETRHKQRLARKVQSLRWLKWGQGWERWVDLAVQADGKLIHSLVFHHLFKALELRTVRKTVQWSGRRWWGGAGHDVSCLCIAFYTSPLMITHIYKVALLATFSISFAGEVVLYWAMGNDFSILTLLFPVLVSGILLGSLCLQF